MEKEKQSQPLRIENPNVGSFATVRTIDSALWFVNSPDVEYDILARLAQYKQKFGIKLYGFVFSGSHFHPLSKFPNGNRAPFFRDLNARAAETVKKHNPDFGGGPLVERRYSEQALPLDEDIEDRFFYCALQPVNDGLCVRLSDYPGYNSFSDAICGIKKTFEIVDWSRYNAARRYNPAVSKANYTTEYVLEYDRLPGYEEMPQAEYKKMMLEKLEQRRQKIVNEILQENPKHRFLTKDELRRVVPGTLASEPKKSTRHEKRPLVLSVSVEAKQSYLDWYFTIYRLFKIAVRKYLAGNFAVEFPPGTYRPPVLVPPPT